ncbi:hypothetical protein LSAT2_019780, partial [Lamellibrachia satsuma]
ALLRDDELIPSKVTRIRKTLILHNNLNKHLKSSEEVACRKAVKSVCQTCSARLLADTLKVNRKVRKMADERAQTKRKLSTAIHR